MKTNTMKKDVSEIAGTAGKVIGEHIAELNHASSLNDVKNFVNKICPEMSEQSQKYVKDIVGFDSPRTNFNSAMRCLYNIYLAGYSDCKVG